MTARRRVAVVGGGIAGVSVAWALAPDHDVTLLETEAALGVHATGRSAAILSETSGPAAVRALAHASRAFLEAPPRGFADGALSAPRGLLWIGRTGDAALLRQLAAPAAPGVAATARRLAPAEAVALVPALRPEAVGGGAWFEPDARTVDVAALVQAYARGARSLGAEIRRGGEVLAASRPRESGWLLETAAGDVRADVVVDAAGAWGDVVAERAGVAPLGLQPRRRTACVVPVEADARSWPMVMDVAGRCYFEPDAGGLLLSPADEHPSAPHDARPEEVDVAWALEALNTATTLGVRTVRRAWAGLRTFTTDRVPAVGWDAQAEDFLWVVGQGGAGIKTAPAVAGIVAALVAGAPWPAALTALGVGAADLDPARLAAPPG